MILGDVIWLCEGIAKRQESEWQMNAFTAYMVAAVNADPKKKMPPFNKWWGIKDDSEGADKKKLIEEAKKRGELFKQKLEANGRV